MTEGTFRSMALSLPEAIESAHMEHPDFRVRGKIFATLGYPSKGWGMVKLTPEQQGRLVQDHPNVFVPTAGAWGARGATNVRLSKADRDTVFTAMAAAWRNIAPNRLAADFDAEKS